MCEAKLLEMEIKVRELKDKSKILMRHNLLLTLTNFAIEVVGEARSTTLQDAINKSKEKAEVCFQEIVEDKEYRRIWE